MLIRSQGKRQRVAGTSDVDAYGSLPVGSVMNAAWTRTVTGRGRISAWCSMLLRHPTAIVSCMNVGELLEVRIFRQFNIRSVEILALHWHNRELTRHCILFR